MNREREQNGTIMKNKVTATKPNNTNRIIINMARSTEYNGNIVGDLGHGYNDGIKRDVICEFSLF